MKRDYEPGDRVSIRNLDVQFNLRTATVMHNNVEERKQNLVLIVDNPNRSRIYVSYSNVKPIGNWYDDLFNPNNQK